jgi:hypothetical protein
MASSNPAEAPFSIPQDLPERLDRRGIDISYERIDDRLPLKKGEKPRFGMQVKLSQSIKARDLFDAVKAAVKKSPKGEISADIPTYYEEPMFQDHQTEMKYLIVGQATPNDRNVFAITGSPFAGNIQISPGVSFSAEAFNPANMPIREDDEIDRFNLVYARHGEGMSWGLLLYPSDLPKIAKNGTKLLSEIMTELDRE